MLLEKHFGITYQELMQLVVTYGSKLLGAIIILIVGFWLAGFLSRAVRKVMTKSEADANLIGFISSLVAGILKLLVAVTAITKLGIEMTSFVAILASAGLAVGMAFSGTLSNFAGGVMILLFKPFRSGDTVFIQNIEGTVKEITIFNTLLTTSDNKIVILANGPVSNGNIINYSTTPHRRVEWRIPIGDPSQFQDAKKLIEEVLLSTEDVLKDKGHLVALGDLSASPNFILVQAWTINGHNSKVFYALNERFFNVLKEHDIAAPSSSLDVNLTK